MERSPYQKAVRLPGLKGHHGKLMTSRALKTKGIKGVTKLAPSELRQLAIDFRRERERERKREREEE